MRTLVLLSAWFGAGLCLSLLLAIVVVANKPSDLILHWPVLTDWAWSLGSVVLASAVFGVGLHVLGRSRNEVPYGLRSCVGAFSFGASACGIIYLAAGFVLRAMEDPSLALVGGVAFCFLFLWAGPFVRIFTWRSEHAG